MQYAWTCHCCGKQFNELPLDFACKVPDPWLAIPTAERDQRGRLSDNVCVIDGRDIFIRGVIEIPVIGLDDRFAWGVWVSVSKLSYARIRELWDAPVIKDEPPRFGWLCNNISVYPPTMNLKTQIHLRGGGLRPSIELEPTDHPLAVEQRQGMPVRRVEEIAAALLLRH
jgi:hypothetical protein